MSKVKITEVALRDAHQSLIATRMTMDEMRPILKAMDEVGYYSLECWGGATFDACIRFLDEDPWDRLRIMRKECPNTKLQMLFRGQNMLGYRPYADDAVEYFVKKSVENGIDILRIFDALNDPRNLETAIKSAINEKAHVQACISYTLSPVHDNAYFANYAKTLENMGAHSICIKDMAGLLTPTSTAELVKTLKSSIKIPVDIHSHYTSGLASMSILKGIEAGADIVDTAISPLSLGTSHMPTESLVATLQGTEYDTGLDLKKLDIVRAHFAKLREKYLASGQLSPKMLGVDANTLLYQVPGGMLSNLLGQLKDAGKEDQLEDVLKEIPNVRKDSGYPPLVTPTSQIVGTQAVFNVIMGERYKIVTKEFKAMVQGQYGKTPAPIDPAFQKKICGDAEPITCRFADTLAPEMDKLREEAAKYVRQEEDVLTYAMFPQVAPKFFEKRNNKIVGVDGDHADVEKKTHIV
ncbi:MAG: oxaloacetate decarboxylase subunit alpha [Oscillospiraceae bacterium]|nr:oxaloacetate decarboxylase subunit alpha [Oscillospiraceae bacterium]